MTAAACVKRLAKLPGVRNTLDIAPKIPQSAMSPKIAGSAPMSPAFTRLQ